MISKISCDTEDWSNDAEKNPICHHKKTFHLKMYPKRKHLFWIIILLYFWSNKSRLKHKRSHSKSYSFIYYINKCNSVFHWENTINRVINGIILWCRLLLCIFLLFRSILPTPDCSSVYIFYNFTLKWSTLDYTIMCHYINNVSI